MRSSLDKNSSCSIISGRILFEKKKTNVLGSMNHERRKKNEERKQPIWSPFCLERWMWWGKFLWKMNEWNFVFKEPFQLGWHDSTLLYVYINFADGNLTIKIDGANKKITSTNYITYTENGMQFGACNNRQVKRKRERANIKREKKKHRNQRENKLKWNT